MRHLQKYKYWLSQNLEREAIEELHGIKGNKEEIKNRFCDDLKFGTAGLRSIMGMGSNRMSIYTVRKATQGLANYINKSGDPERGIVIAYDSRRDSERFALSAALCMCANKIKTYLFEDMRSVPQLSFSIRSCPPYSA